MERKILLFAAVVYTIVLSVSSLASLKNVPVQKLELSDKMLHGIAYFILVVIWSLALPTKIPTFRVNKILIVGVCALFFGIVIEVLQGILTTYRQGEWYDILANFAGIILAVGLLTYKSKM